MQQHRARVGVLEAEIAELQQRVDMAEAARTKAWLTVALSGVSITKAEKAESVYLPKPTSGMRATRVFRV